MNIANILTRLAPKIPKVYDAGKTDYGYKKSASGNDIHIDDINAKEKNLSVVLTSKSLTDFSNTTITVSSENILKMPNYSGVNVHKENSKTQINTVVDNGTVTMRGYLGYVVSAGMLFNPYIPEHIAVGSSSCKKSTLDTSTAIKLPKGTYLFTENKNGGSIAKGRFFVYSDSQYATYYNNGQSFTITEDNCYGAFAVDKNFNTDADIPDFYYSAKPELIFSKDYTANSDGTINGITACYPVTNMRVNGSSDAVIHTEYYLDVPYEKGKTDFGYKKSVSGDPLSINDININEKTINAVLTSDSLTDFSKKKIRVCGKNILRLPDKSGTMSHYENNATSLKYSMKNGIFTVQGYLGKVSQNSAVFNPYIWGLIGNYTAYITMDSLHKDTAIKLPKGTYTFFENRGSWSTATGSLLVYTGDTYAKNYTSGSVFTITKDGCYGAFVLSKTFSADIPDFYYSAQPMVVCGEELLTAKMYEPYNGKDYTADADGTINDITTYYPITNMFVQGSSDASIHTDYYADSEKVVQDLTDTIISLGGTV